MTDTINVEFLAVTPLSTYRRLAEIELRRDVDPAVLRQLHANPALWHRALLQISLDIQNHIAKARRRLADLRVDNGQPSAEYMEAKRDHDLNHARRLHFQRIVERRLDEVRSLLGPDQAINRMLVGDVVGVLAEIAEHAARGDLDAARDKANFHAARWAAEYGRATGSPS